MANRNNRRAALPPPSHLTKLIARFRDAQRRCSGSAKSKDRTYGQVSFDFASPREAAEYMLEKLGPVPPGYSIDRINPFQGYRKGNLRYANTLTQRTNQISNAGDD